MMGGDLIDLVRKTLPALALARQWAVIPVDSFDDAGADIDAGLVRVSKTWRTSIFETGLSRVGRHYLLALQGFEQVDPRAVLRNLRVQWRGYQLYLARAVTLEQYWRARFTGDLISGPAFIAKVGSEGRMAAEATAVDAAREALRLHRAPEWRGRAEMRELRDLRNKACLLVSQVGLDHPYDPHRDRIAIASYEGIFPAFQLDYLKHYGSEGVPIPSLKHACMETIPHMERINIQRLLVQFGLDVSAAQAAFKKRTRLTSEDERALETILGMPLDLTPRSP